ncbi:MAG: adenylate/guanylate cyclase domain-containing protein [Chloroflexi bacterium]|nr:adenylate/guanylate cyclase domain-containing protein [Chloroflexota bacterium]
MEPRIQYAKTSDGVNIAYWTLGEGTPLIYMPTFPYSHLQLEWKNERRRRWYQRLAEKTKLIRYDGRGTGLSERDAVNHSLETDILDLEAVASRLHLEKFSLFAFLHAGPAAITYAVRNPDRVSHLILWCTYAVATDYLESPQGQAVRALVSADWDTYVETAGRLVFGWAEAEQGTEFAEMVREGTTQAATEAYLQAVDQVDVTALLPKVQSQTLVLHRRQLRWPPLEVTTSIVSGIPDAHLAPLEGSSAALHTGDMEAAVRAISEFLGAGDEVGDAEHPEPGAFRTILFTDVEGSTALTDRLGDAKARDILREHERITRDALKQHGGSEIKTMGDGFMASFASATKALECAIAMQRAFAQRNERAEESIRVRIGLNAGEPIAEDDPGGRGDLFGTAVNMAARVAAKAESGEILASNVVRELVAGKGFLFNDRGETELRGFEDPVRLYEVSWRVTD